MPQQATGCEGMHLWAVELLPTNIRNFKRQMSLLTVLLFGGKERKRVQPFLEVQ